MSNVTIDCFTGASFAKCHHGVELGRQNRLKADNPQLPSCLNEHISKKLA